MNITDTTAAPLFDHLLDAFKLKNDAALARCLRVPPSVICRMRHGVKPLSSGVIVRIHEYSAMPVAKIKALAGIPRFDLQ